MKRVAALLFALCAATLVRADIGPPPGKKVVPVTTVVEATEAFPDYAFFEVSYSSTPGPPPHGGSSTSTTYHFFVPGTTIKATGDRRSSGALFAVPKAVVESDIVWKLHAAEAAKQSPPKHMSISTSTDWSALRTSVSKGEVPGGTSIQFGGSEELAPDETLVVVRGRVDQVADNFFLGPAFGRGPLLALGLGEPGEDAWQRADGKPQAFDGSRHLVHSFSPWPRNAVRMRVRFPKGSSVGIASR